MTFETIYPVLHPILHLAISILATLVPLVMIIPYTRFSKGSTLKKITGALIAVSIFRIFNWIDDLLDSMNLQSITNNSTFELLDVFSGLVIVLYTLYITKLLLDYSEEVGFEHLRLASLRASPEQAAPETGKPSRRTSARKTKRRK